jgi:hypothetical protein
MATRPAAITSRETRASTRSSTRERSEESDVSIWSPITEDAGRMTSSNCGTLGGSGCGSTGLGGSGAGGAGAACGSGWPDRTPPVIGTVRAGALSGTVRAGALSLRAVRVACGVAGADVVDADVVDADVVDADVAGAGSWRRGAGAGAGSAAAFVPCAFETADESLFGLTAASVSATGWDAPCAGVAVAGTVADGVAGADATTVPASVPLCRVATYAPPAAAVTQPRASRTNASGLENMN